MRHERPDHVLQPAALVNELYLRLFAVQKLDVQAASEFYRLADAPLSRPETPLQQRHVGPLKNARISILSTVSRFPHALRTC
jgi:hypothetical protein